MRWSRRHLVWQLLQRCKCLEKFLCAFEQSFFHSMLVGFAINLLSVAGSLMTEKCSNLQLSTLQHSTFQMPLKDGEKRLLTGLRPEMFLP